jgi:hypothetical protein
VATLRAYGIVAALPIGFEGHIFQRAPGPQGDVPHTVAQFATFALPDDVGDFGGGAVTRMGPTDVFCVLFEYGPESLGTARFARPGPPQSLGVSDFRPTVLRRGLAGQSGTQWFFTASGRPFTFYAVLGANALASRLVPQVNALLASLQIGGPVPSAAGSPWS